MRKDLLGRGLLDPLPHGLRLQAGTAWGTSCARAPFPAIPGLPLEAAERAQVTPSPSLCSEAPCPAERKRSPFPVVPQQSESEPEPRAGA